MEERSLTKAEISRYLEITEPFLLIDQIEDLVPGKSARGLKKLAETDWFFQCHLRREQAMPGTLLTEAMLQTLVLTIYTMEGHEGRLSFVTDIRTKLLSKVAPGDQLVIRATLSSYHRGIARGEAVGQIGNKTVCQGEFAFASPHDLPRLRSGAH